MGNTHATWKELLTKTLLSHDITKSGQVRLVEANPCDFDVGVPGRMRRATNRRESDGNTMLLNCFELFRDDPLEPQLLASFEDLDAAQEAMKAFLLYRPGQYFIWRPTEDKVVERLCSGDPFG